MEDCGDNFSNILATQLCVWDYILQECVFHLVGAYDGIFPCQNSENGRDGDIRMSELLGILLAFPVFFYVKIYFAYF